MQQWQEIKAQEKQLSGAPTSVLDGVPRHMPALQQGEEIGKKAAKVGFDWPTVAAAMDKVREELAELQQAFEEADQQAIEEELGDMLFALTSVSRKAGINSEQALKNALTKFKRRFSAVEERLRHHSAPAPGLAQLENWWQEAKDSG